MNILIDIAHPAHVHLFRNFIKEMSKRGNKIIVTARNKDITFKLLDAYQIPYIILGGHYKSLIGKIFGAISHVIKLFLISAKHKIDIFLDAGTIYPAPVSFFLRRPNITIDNTDVDFTLAYAKPFTTVFITPVSFNKNLGDKHIRCESFNELAFLHPKYFNPDKEILKNLGVSEGEKFILLRFVLWKAVDDIGYKGYNEEEIRDMVIRFSRFGKVFISCEYELPMDLQKIQIEKNEKIKFGQMPHIEYFATLLFGESGAMASECAMLGTPAYFVSPKTLGFTEELDKRFGLIFDFKDKKGAVEHALNLLENKNIKKEWLEKRNKMLEHKINYTDFLVWFVEKFPESFKIMKKDNSYQFNFKG
jgi:predicted glycosyltransferase